MGKIEQVGSELREVSQPDFRQTRELLAHLIQRSQREHMAAEKAAPVHELKGS
jgi:hypothetical protein